MVPFILLLTTLLSTGSVVDAGHTHSASVSPAGKLEVLSTERSEAKGRTHSRDTGTASLLRREDSAKTEDAAEQSARLLQRLVLDAERSGPRLPPAPTFNTTALRSCDPAEAESFYEKHPDVAGDVEKSQKAITLMRSLVEVRRILETMNVPVVLIGNTLLGWRRSCTVAAETIGEVAIFGPWLQAAGPEKVRDAFHERGHTLDMDRCEGALNAGCELHAWMYDAFRGRRDGVYISILVLFSAPPPAVGRMPGFWSQCDRKACGEDCGMCSLAYSHWIGQNRFHACPVLLQRLVPATWMGEMFWVPEEGDLQTYLLSQYGEAWQDPEASRRKQTCGGQEMDSLLSLSWYPSYVPGLLDGTDVIEQQRQVQRNFSERISAVTDYENRLWQQTFISVLDMDPSEEPWRFPRSYTAKVLSIAHPWLPSTNTLWIFTAILSLACCIVIVNKSSFLDAALGVNGFFGITRSLQGWVFASFVFLSMMQMFLQKEAGSTRYSLVSAAILIYLARVVVSVCMCLCKGQLKKVWRLSEKKGGVPVYMLTMIPGAMYALYDWLSFQTQSSLDPVSTVILRLRLVVIAVVWQVTFQKNFSAAQWLAFVACSAASSVEAFGHEMKAGRLLPWDLLSACLQVVFSVCASIVSEVLLKDCSVPTDLINACSYLQGLLVLLVAEVCTAPAGSASLDELISAPARERLLKDPRMVASMACLTAFGIVTAYFLRELSNPVKELSSCVVILFSALAQVMLSGWQDFDGRNAQAMILSVLAIGLYNIDALSIKRPAIRDPQAKAKATAKPTPKPKAKAKVEPAPKKAAPSTTANKSAPSTKTSQTARLATHAIAEAAAAEGHRRSVSSGSRR
eukprot:gb/GFBE01012923.1/.p1 GENE.gb/GFBE01012923.1/~~gb/GFBE01012923.1/.p1  ORF type:complete len:853 (+),score=166.29 gb/GFBE01012923.1/:1-2559(+)